MSFPIRNDYEIIFNYLKKDNEEAYRLIFKYCYKPLYGFVFNIVRDREETEDIVQKTFIKLWENKQHIESATHLKPWLYLVAKNLALNFNVLKKQKTSIQDHTKVTYHNPENILHARDVQYTYLKAIRKLPQPCQSVYRLAYLEEYTYQDISTQLGISIKSVEYQLHKAVELLQQQLIKFKD